ncbi:MAG: hypothetical protein IPM29_20270 [Planctomycetes bacterium]|nr:hypothetical protein [Planctomycetota bacterium]
MARAKKAAAPTRTAKPAAATRAKKAEVSIVDDQGVEIVKKGMDIDDGIVIGAGLVTLGAWVLIYMAGSNYGF